MSCEQTIRSAVECQGVGLHSGVSVRLKILPAPAGKGIVFRRVDLDGFEIEAIGRNVAKVSYATSLMKKGVLISTTEHLLAAFIGMGIDNAIVELDNLEIPILDGSAQTFVDMIVRAGIRRQRRRRASIRILRPLELREGGKCIAVYPDSNYSVAYTIDFPHPLIGRETFRIDLSNGEFLRELASARTFGFLEQESALRNMGLIRGASRDNCIVLDRRWRGERSPALPQRIRSPQGARPDRRSCSPGPAPHRTRGRRPRRPCHAHRPGFPPAEGPLAVGRGRRRSPARARSHRGAPFIIVIQTLSAAKRKQTRKDKGKERERPRP